MPAFFIYKPDNFSSSSKDFVIAFRFKNVSLNDS